MPEPADLGPGDIEVIARVTDTDGKVTELHITRLSIDPTDPTHKAEFTAHLIDRGGASEFRMLLNRLGPPTVWDAELHLRGRLKTPDDDPHRPLYSIQFPREPEATTSHLCPECVQGKHRNCDGRAWDPDTDDFTTCDCGDDSHG